MDKTFLTKIELEETDYSSILKKIGKRIKIIRIEKDLSLLELSLITDLSTSYLSKIENGKAYKPTLQLYLKICQGLEIKPSEILIILDKLSPFDSF